MIHITICGDTLVEQFIDFILLPLGEYLNNIPIDNVHTNYIDAVKTGLYWQIGAGGYPDIWKWIIQVSYTTLKFNLWEMFVYRTYCV